VTSKEYLSQVPKMDRLIKSRQEQLARMESLSVSAGTSVFSESGVRVSRDPSKGSKLDNQVSEIVDLKDSIRLQLAKMVELRKEVSGVISKINNLTLEFILEERYLNCKSWDAICDQTGYSKDYIWRLHRKALDSCQPYVPQR
jgi:hypothetical protein